MSTNGYPRSILIPIYFFCIASVQTEVIESVTRLIENEECLSGEYKYMASITNGQLRHYCDGSVLSNVWILTAAHCLRAKNEMRVRVTVTKTDTNGQVLAVQSTHTKRQYDGKELTHDVGLIKLSTTIRHNADFDNFRHTSLPTKVSPRLACLNALSYTWVHSKDNSLRCTELSIIPTDDCTNRYPSLDRWATIGKNSTICATSKYGREACKGKSGGPLMCNGMVQVGILYWHTGCTGKQYHGIYTRIDAHHDWIWSLVMEGQPRTRAKSQGCVRFVSRKLMLAGLCLTFLGGFM